MIEIVSALKLLGDETRLRILRLLGREPLNVSELTSILGLAQSGISRHLGLLRKAELVEERREGVYSYYQIPAEIRSSLETTLEGTPSPELWQVWEFVRARLQDAEDPFHDLPRLTEVLRQRENYGGGLNEKLLEPGQSWFAWSRALHGLLPALEAIDLGCGDGTITVELGRFAKRVLGVDIDPRMVVAARKKVEREGMEHVTFKEDRIETLQEPDQSFDLAVFSQSLHHLRKPAEGILQGARVVRPGGRLVIFDLAPHNEQWVMEKLNHLHLGFTPEALVEMMKEAGLTNIHVEPVYQRRGEAFHVLLATGEKPRQQAKIPTESK